MQVGAIITPSFPQENEIDAPAGPRRRDGLTSGTSDIVLNALGNNLLERTTALLCNAGVERPTVVRDLPFNRISRERSSNFSNSSSAWEQSIAQLAQQGPELLLLIGSAAYTDLDYAELVRFHRERRAIVTQAYATDGALDIAVINSSRLRSAPPSSLLKLITGPRERFSYRGYVNRLRGLVDCMQLVEDALYRRCDLKPAATEVANGVWIGEDAEVDDSCVIGSPCFIGEKTRIAACSNISAGSAIESACHIDSGTVINQSWILPDTYVGVGLNVHRSIVNKKKIFHLDRGTEITISDPRLIGSTRSFPLFRGGERLFSRTQVGT